MIWWPWRFTPARTTPRMTALSPGQSPPPVRMPIRAIGGASCQTPRARGTRFDAVAARCRVCGSAAGAGGCSEHDARLRVLDAELALEGAQHRVELGGVAAGDLQVVVEPAGDVRGVHDAVELLQVAFEAVVGLLAREADVDERGQPPTGRRLVDRRREAGDRTAANQAPDAVGGRVGAEAGERSELAVGGTPVAHELLEDCAVDGVHGLVIRGDFRFVVDLLMCGGHAAARDERVC